MDGLKLAFLVSQYGVLEQLAQNVSTLDLLNLALTCKELYARIRASDAIFERLKRVALCDGHGLKARQDFTGFFELKHSDSVWGKGRKAHFDQEIEVRVWNLKCDAANSLPCLRCGVNVCDECRYMPRVQETPGWQSRCRPYLDPSHSTHDIICYCPSCDDKVEQSLPLRLSEFCDCHQYTRWICIPCKVKEEKPNTEYLITRTKGSWGIVAEDVEGVMMLLDHQEDRYFWCPCGKKAPKDGNIRCLWCLRRHNLETWKLENPNRIPFFDDDPCYPKFVYDQFGEPVMYPDLAYRGLIAP